MPRVKKPGCSQKTATWPFADDAVDNLVDDGAFARTLRAIKQIAPAMQIAMALKGLAQGPESLDFIEDFAGQAVREVDEIIDLQIAMCESGPRHID